MMRNMDNGTEVLAYDGKQQDVLTFHTYTYPHEYHDFDTHEKIQKNHL